MKLIVAGIGYVGSTVADYLENDGCIIIRIDPKYYDTSIYDHLDADGCIICVNTPSLPDGGCDDSNVQDVIYQVYKHMPSLVKSSVLPTLVDGYPSSVSMSPEFLRASNAKEDFQNQSFMIIGDIQDKFRTFWADVFKNFTCHYTNSQVASTVKYIHNAWLATKVVFFNEVYSEVLSDYGEMVTILKLFENKIGSTHMDVPGPDGKFGFGGACFPKDTEALLTILDSDILATAVEKNKRMRN